MIKSKTSPGQWLEMLTQTLARVECKIKGGVGSQDLAFEALSDIFKCSIEKKNNIWWIGNGGSAAICSHLSQDLLNKLSIKSTFCGESALMTCMANDYGYENIYSKPLQLLWEEDDVLIAISSSGNSENILSCARMAKEQGVKLITLSGFHRDNQLWNMPAQVSFYVPSQLYGHVETCHEAILHAVIECLWKNTQIGK